MVTSSSINTVTHSTPPPFVRIKGTHRQIGQQMGEACAPQIRHSVETARSQIQQSYDSLGLNWESALIQAQKYLPFAQERYPQYLDELTGLSESAGVSLGEIAVLTAFEAVTSDALHLGKCTSMAVNGDRTADGHVLAAHNEDWTPEDESDICIVHVSPDDEPPFLAMMYGGYLPNIGLNAYGLAQCCDTVHPSDSRVGIPRIIVSRAVFAARTIGEAIRCTVIPRRAAGYNHLLAHESGEIYSVEVSSRRFAILYAHENCLAHTNHYLDSAMQEIEKDPEELLGTRIRHSRALNFLLGETQHTIKSLQNIQRDHVNYPTSICSHATEVEHWYWREKTICSLVIDLTDRAMHVAWGNPCQNPYHTFYLDA
jgi:isopenicillin-N N-acyltransferase-like protein